MCIRDRYNLVANLAYGERYADVYPLIQAEINKYQAKFFAETAQLDESAAALFKNGSDVKAIELLTKYCETTGDWMTSEWRQFWMVLFSRVRDGFNCAAPKLPQCKPGQTKGCTSRVVPHCAETGYSTDWYARMISDPANAAHYRVPAPTEEDRRKLLRMDKKR
eukprot:TRINITY_DN1496_c0_g1_i5.p1 TRINITY_DN1496_c0_g1~~TRINITY_DN1496_c0_g1_i5.p1  ORF type:complete len:164 (+),score=42.40 TRINITY_DN1496_c0_g1_i5:94-585(+)